MWLWIALAALLSGAAAYAIAFMIGLDVTQSPDCDGICVQKLNEIGLVALAVSVVCAVVVGFITRAILKWRFASRFAKPS